MRAGSRVAVAMGLVLAASAARADRNDTLCYGSGGTDEDTIAGCTAVLNRAKKESRKNQAAAYYNRGLAYASKGDASRAFLDFDNAIKLDATDARYFRNRGLMYDEKEERERAVSDYDEAIRLDPAYASARFDRGYDYALRQDYDRAIRDYDEVIRLDPERTFAYYSRGLAYEKKADLEAALRDLDEAARRDPKDANVREAGTRVRAALSARAPLASGAKGGTKVEGKGGAREAATIADLEVQERAVVAVWERLPFSARHAMFVTRKAEAFGGYARRPTNVFAPGEPLLSYIEPTGYAWQAVGDDSHRISVSVDFEVIDTAGKILGGQKEILKQEFTTHYRNREFFLNSTFTADVDPGDYVLAYTLRDNVGGRATRVEQPFTIRK